MPTFRFAKKNLDANPMLSAKITQHNFGLGKADASLKVAYSQEWKGSIGVGGSTKSDIRNNALESTEQIEIRDAKRVFEGILAKSAGTSVIVKMDCEGAEYEIFDAIAGWEGLEQIKAFMIEWHLEGPDKLVNILKNGGFLVYSLFSNPDENVGMLYACR